MSRASPLVPLFTPWPAVATQPRRRSWRGLPPSLRHPWAALRDRFALLPLPWRRRVLALLPLPPRAAPPSPPGSWLAELPGLPPARPVLALVGEAPLPPSLPPPGGGWAVMGGGQLPREGPRLRDALAGAAGSPHPVGCVVALERGHAEAAVRLGRTLGWPAALLEQPAAPLGEAAAALFSLLTVVVVVYRHPGLTRLCLEALRRWTAWPHLEVLVVDNASPDGAGAAARETAHGDGRVRVIESETNLGFAGAANLGVAAGRGEVLALLNHDVVVSPGWEVPLVQHLLAHPEAGLVGPSTNAAGNRARVRASYRTLEEFVGFARGQANTPRRPLAMGELGFFCVAVRRRVWEELEGLDEGYGLGYFEDADFCRRARAAGWRLACLRESFVHHLQGAAFATLPPRDLDALWEANRRRFLARRRRGP